MDTIQSAIGESIPYRLCRKERTLCEWLNTKGNVFSEPFFNDSISTFKGFAENSNAYTSISSLEMMEEWGTKLENIPDPSAIIFHVSRCGSTLFSQLLGLNERNMVLSEVPFLDELLRLPLKQENITEENVARLFKASIRIYANSRDQIPARIIIKSDSWHLCFYEKLREMFPDTAFILLFRDPWEVVKSQQRRRGMQSVPGVVESILFGFTQDQARETNLDKYMSMVLFRYFTRMIDIAKKDTKTLLVNYAQGSLAISEKLFSFLNIPMDAGTQAVISERIKFHGKYPGQLFAEENEVLLRPDFLDPVLELYKELEQMRLLRDESRS